MGLFSKLKGIAQQVVSIDPVLKQQVKYDPAARQLVKDTVGLPGQGAAAPQPGAAAERPVSSMPYRSDVGWQADRIAAMRARFGLGGATTAGRKTIQPVPGISSPSAPTPTTAPGALSASVQPAANPGQMPASPGTSMAASPSLRAPSLNPAAADVTDYSKAWNNMSYANHTNLA